MSSAVLFVERLSVWSIGQRKFSLILNPWARNPLPSPLPEIEVHRGVEENLTVEAGRSLAELLALCGEWPGQ
jgi:hypothetical protein